jgi:uncharacterized protein YifN (PemK superfamily)
MHSPTKKTETVTIVKTVEYWDCGLGHKHTTEEIALMCMFAEAEKPANRLKNAKRWTQSEKVNIDRLRDQGLSWAKIAKVYGISSSRMQQAYNSIAYRSRRHRRKLTRHIAAPTIRSHSA